MIAQNEVNAQGGLANKAGNYRVPDKYSNGWIFAQNK